MSDFQKQPTTLVQLLRPAALDPLSRAIDLLSTDGPLEPAATHEIRKSVKRIRAVLQLVRSDLETQFKEWNDLLRTVNRTLSSARDFDVCRQTVQELLPRSSPAHRTVLERLHTELTRQQALISGELPVDPRPVLGSTLLTVKSALLEWQPEQTGFGLIRPAVRRMARQARRLIRRLQQDPTHDGLHALRKIVKRRLYWLEALQPIWPRGLQAERKLVDILADDLGKHHDLAVLREHLQSSAEGLAASEAKPVKSVSRRLVRRQRKLEVRSLRLARYLFAERPQAFSRRWNAFVKVWRDSPAAAIPLKTVSQPADIPVKTRPR